jgi:hypothetical protein
VRHASCLLLEYFVHLLVNHHFLSTSVGSLQAPLKVGLVGVLAQQLSDSAVDSRGASVHSLNDGLENWNLDIEKLLGLH